MSSASVLSTMTATVADDPDIADAYGPLDDATVQGFAHRRRQFLPWHHPAKQAVRAQQWATQIERLISDGHVSGRVLRYLTLPGADMMDVRYIGNRLQNRPGDPWKLEVFGFDRSAADTDSPSSLAEEALAALRQDQLATMESTLRVGQIEEIAVDGSVAERHLRDARPFDVINLDACSHLCGEASQDGRSLFAALERLMLHQLQRRNPWLLLITTRAAATNFTGDGAEKLKSIVEQNISSDGESFTKELRTITSIDQNDGGASAAWAGEGELFLKMFTVGLGKHLLHYFNNQRPWPARVELRSVFGYRVGGAKPDMLAVAFRVSPVGAAPVPAARITALSITPPSIASIRRLVQRAASFRDVDEGFRTENGLLQKSVREQAELLSAANYSITGWIEWLRNHSIRPIDCSGLLDEPA